MHIYSPVQIRIQYYWETVSLLNIFSSLIIFSKLILAPIILGAASTSSQ